MMKATGAAPISNFKVYTTGGGCLQAPVSYPANLCARAHRQLYNKKGATITLKHRLQEIDAADGAKLQMCNLISFSGLELQPGQVGNACYSACK